MKVHAGGLKIWQQKFLRVVAGPDHAEAVADLIEEQEVVGVDLSAAVEKAAALCAPFPNVAIDGYDLDDALEQPAE